MERAERLLDLVALFLNASEAVSWPDIQEAFPADYAHGSPEANIRKFERDKADLLELGIALVYLQGEEREKDGYELDRTSYYLPELRLQPDELAVLFAAGAAALSEEAFPFREDLSHALKKMAFAAGDRGSKGARPAGGSPHDWTRLPAPRELTPREAGGSLAHNVAELSRALASRKRTTFRYHSLQRGELLERQVDPYGLVYRFGSWILAGHCHLRAGRRHFRVDRIRDLKLNEARPRSPDFEVPADFRLADIAAARPWEYEKHPPLEARVRFASELAFLAARDFPSAAQVERGPRGVVLAVPVRDGEALLRALLPLGEGVEILGPPELRARAKELLSELLERHGGLAHLRRKGA